MMKSGLTAVLLIAFMIATYAWVFTVLANYRGISRGVFWGGSAAIMAPWLLATLGVGAASLFVPARLQTAAGMAGLFPALVFCFTLLLAPLISLFATAHADFGKRIRWFGGLSAVPAVLLSGFLIYVMIVDSLKDGGGAS